MKANYLFLTSLILAMPGVAIAADTVSFTLKASQPSLSDKSQPDSFIVGVADKQVETNLRNL